MTLHDRILDVADALTEPHIHTEPIPYWDNNRNRKIRRHATVQPGLLAQLYESVMPASSSADGPAGCVPGSRPPLAMEALSCHDQITTAVERWCRSLGITPRASVESNVRALVGSAMDDDAARALLAEMRQWQRWCAVLTGWESVYRPAGVPCPVLDCWKSNTLRINLTAKTAMCQACKATWSEEDGSVFVLADHIRAKSERVTQQAG